MSVVISFRLNPNRPRDAQALEVLRTKKAEGYSCRQIMTDALLSMVTTNEQDMLISLEEIKVALDYVTNLFEPIEGRNRCDTGYPLDNLINKELAIS